MLDIANDKDCSALIERHYMQGKIVCAVSHGLAAFLTARTSSGEPIVKGKKASLQLDASSGNMFLTDCKNRYSSSKEIATLSTGAVASEVLID